jgi:hypothetical protein
MSIVRNVCELNCHWTEVEGAVSQAEEIGLTAEEIESGIRGYRFRYEDPIVVLSEDQSRLLAQLTDRRLMINRCESGPFRQGFTVFKPTRVPGNSRPGWGSSVVSLDQDGNFDEDGDTSDAPIARLYPEPGDIWVFLISAYSGGVGPGDYVKRHNGLEPAVADLIDYYFGDPKRMTPQAYIDREERLGRKAKS